MKTKKFKIKNEEFEVRIGEKNYAYKIQFFNVNKKVNEFTVDINIDGFDEIGKYTLYKAIETLIDTFKAIYPQKV